MNVRILDHFFILGLKYLDREIKLIDGSGLLVKPLKLAAYEDDLDIMGKSV